MKDNRHILYFLRMMSLLASGLLCLACVKNDPVGKDASYISFSTPVVSSLTKTVAGPVDGEYPAEENFCVNAVWSPGDLKEWGDDECVTYMNEVEVKHDGGSPGSWNPQSVSGQDPYVWPFDGKLTFAAFSPASVKQMATYDASGLHIEGFEIPASIALQYDLLYSERSYNRVDNTNMQASATYAGVDLVFRHALSAVRFQVKSSNNYKEAGTELKITGLTLKGAYCKGDFDENITDGAQYVADPRWTPDRSVQTATYACWSDTEGQPLTTTVARLGEGTSAGLLSDMILLPQVLDDAGDQCVQIAVTYKIKHKNEAQWTSEETTIGLSTEKISEWEMGKRYIYTLTVGMDRIFFSPEVEERENIDNRPNVTI